VFTGIMSLLVAEVLGVINDRVYMVKEETEDLKKEVIFESFAFSYASSYIFFVNMTTSIMCSNSMILSASKK
jgi:hypothetical protein